MRIELTGVCGQKACPFATSGVCLDGYADPSECPSFIPDEEADDVEDDSGDEVDTNVTEDNTGAVFFSEKELYDESVDALLSSVPTKVIVIAGKPKSGKTTLLSTLVDQFHKGEYAGYLFHGSQTLGGFEERCFDARLASNRVEPDTGRTLLEKTIRFLHLSVRSSNLEDPKSLLFADISGELFEQMQMNTEDVQQQGFLRRADHIVLLFDTARLADIEKRQIERTSGLTLVQSLVQEGMIGKDTSVDVVFSRWDKAFNDDEIRQNATHRFVEKLHSDFDGRFQGAIKTLSFFKVAARPVRISGLPPAFGLDTLFLKWLEEQSLSEHQDTLYVPPPTIEAFLEYSANSTDGDLQDE